MVLKWAYYNEIDPYCVVFLKNLIRYGLIPNGDVDDRDIREVQPADLVGYAHCHFFAGVGGWARALRIAEWPDERAAWTGSCPCQPHSSAARGRNVAPDLWGPFCRLIAARAPGVVFGEQVANAGSMASAMTWRYWTTKSGRRFCHLSLSAKTMRALGCTLSATPTAKANQACPSMRKWIGCRSITEVSPEAWRRRMGYPIGWQHCEPTVMRSIRSSRRSS